MNVNKNHLQTFKKGVLTTVDHPGRVGWTAVSANIHGGAYGSIGHMIGGKHGASVGTALGIAHGARSGYKFAKVREKALKKPSGRRGRKK